MYLKTTTHTCDEKWKCFPISYIYSKGDRMAITVKLLHEAIGMVVAAEMVTGDAYKGTLRLVEDNFNCWLADVVHTFPNGEREMADSVYLRGSNVLFVTVPDMLSDGTFMKTGEASVEDKPFKGKLKRTFISVKVRKKAK